MRTRDNHFSMAFTYAWMRASEPGLVNWRTFLAGVRKGKLIFL